MRTEIGIGLVGLGWMGEMHTRGYRRLFDHHPAHPLEPEPVTAGERGPHSDSAESYGLGMMLVEIRTEDLGGRLASDGNA